MYIYTHMCVCACVCVCTGGCNEWTHTPETCKQAWTELFAALGGDDGIKAVRDKQVCMNTRKYIHICVKKTNFAALCGDEGIEAVRDKQVGKYECIFQ